MSDLFWDVESSEIQFNGHTCEGWSDDEDSFTVPDVELYNVKRGADGKMMVLGTANKGGEVMLKFLPNSRSTQFFGQQASRIREGTLVQFDGSYNNPNSGLSVRFERGVLRVSPFGQTQGKGDAANREFTLEFESIVVNYDAARFSGPPSRAAGLI